MARGNRTMARNIFARDKLHVENRCLSKKNNNQVQVQVYWQNRQTQCLWPFTKYIIGYENVNGRRPDADAGQMPDGCRTMVYERRGLTKAHTERMLR